MLALLITSLLGLFCCSSIVYNVENHQNNDIIYRDNSRKDIIYRSPNYYIAFSELCSQDYLNSIKVFMQSAYNGYYSAWANPTTEGYGDYINLLQDSPVTPTDRNIDHVFYISQIGASDTPTAIFDARRLRLYCKQSHYENFWINFYMIGFGNDGNGYEYTLEYYEYINISGSQNLPNYNYVGGLFSSTIYYQNLNVSEDRIIPTDYAFFFRRNSTCFLMSEDYINQKYGNGSYIGYFDGYNDGQAVGYQDGYADGVADASYQDPVANSIFNGIIQVGLLPVNVFLMILNFDVFGINIAGFVSALLTISIVIIIFRFVLGGKEND